MLIKCKNKKVYQTLNGKDIRPTLKDVSKLADILNYI
jgi:hypothetical protein